MPRLQSSLSGTCWHREAPPSKLFQWYKSWYCRHQDQGFDKIHAMLFSAFMSRQALDIFIALKTFAGGSDYAFPLGMIRTCL
jgi:hypothetical protein